MTGITKISYNGFDFQNQPTPFITKDESFIKYGENFGSVQTFNLNGEITGKDFDALRSFQKEIITGFAKDFGVFKIQDVREDFVVGNNILLENSSKMLSEDLDDLLLEQEAGSTIFKDILSKTGVKINSVNFPSNTYKKRLNYNISLTCYPSDYFNENYGVVDPQDQWSFSQSNDDILSATHTISAKGFETGSYNESLAFENAQNFVNGKTGLSNLIFPYFMSGAKSLSSEYLYLDSVNESTDRIGGVYSITENYVRDLKNISGGYLRYNASIDSEGSSSLKVRVQGSVVGNKQASMSGVRARFLGFNVYGAANDFILQTNASSSISEEPVSKSITEDLINKKIDFNYSFDDTERQQTKTDLNISVNSGLSVTTVSVNGSIKSSAPKHLRSGLIESEFNGIDFFNLANGEYNYFYKNNPTKGLNSTPVGQSFSRDSKNYSIRFGREFNNKDKPESGIKELKTVLSFRPSIKKVTAFELPEKNGLYDVIDLESTKRASLQISINASPETGVTASESLSILEENSNSLLNRFGRLDSLQLESASNNTGETERMSLSSSYSFISPNTVFLGTNYDTINTFEV
jgi:hypothetical protein